MKNPRHAFTTISLTASNAAKTQIIAVKIKTFYYGGSERSNTLKLVRAHKKHDEVKNINLPNTTSVFGDGPAASHRKQTED